MKKTNLFLVAIIIVSLSISLALLIKNRKIVKSENQLVIEDFPNIVKHDYNCEPAKKKLNIALQQNLIFGGDNNNPHTNFYRVLQVIPDQHGNIYVSQGGDESSLKKYDSSGRYLATLAKHGMGPGEVSRYFQFSIDSIITIVDKRKQVIEQLDLNGKFIRSTRLDVAGIDIWDFSIADHLLYLGYKNKKKLTNTILVYDQTLKQLQSISMGKLFKEPTTPPERYYIYPSLEGKFFVNDRFIYYIAMGRYMIYRFSKDGNLNMLIRKRCDLTPDAYIDLKTVPGGMGYIYYYSPSMIKRIDDYILVALYSKKKENGIGSVVDIFSPEGDFLGSLALKKQILFTSIDHNFIIYGTLFDENGIEKIVRYNLMIK